MKFNIESRGFHHGQKDLTLSLLVDDKTVAYIDYSEYENVPHIQMIKVFPGFERRKYATLLVRELQRNYPEEEIRWGLLTNDGEQLYKSLSFKNVIDKSIENKTKLLKSLNDRVNELNKKVSNILDNANMPLESNVSELVNSMFSRINRLNDKIEFLNRDLYNKSLIKKIVV